MLEKSCESLHVHLVLRLLNVDNLEVEFRDHAVNERLKIVLLVLPVQEHILDIVLSAEL